MAALTLLTAASLGKSRIADGTYIVAFPGYTKAAESQVPCIHALLPVTATGGGEWVEVTTDA